MLGLLSQGAGLDVEQPRLAWNASVTGASLACAQHSCPSPTLKLSPRPVQLGCALGHRAHRSLSLPGSGLSLLLLSREGQLDFELAASPGIRRQGGDKGCYLGRSAWSLSLFF